MELILQISVILEMLFVNLCTAHICCKKKYATYKVIGILVVFTAVFLAGSLYFLSITNGFGKEKGIFVLFGFLYFPLLKLLYDEKLSRILEIACSAWIYTMIVLSMSVYFGKLFPHLNYYVVGFIFQTVIYLIATPLFWRFIKLKLVYILQNIPKQDNKLLRAESFLWFLTAVVVYLTSVIWNNSYLNLLALLCIAGDAFLSYYLLHSVVKNMKNVENLKSIAYQDSLTGAKNRISLFQDIDRKIEQKQTFVLLFLDLDKFKGVNDQYGHLAGDNYLCSFTNRMQEILANRQADFYRVAGDEFICIIPSEQEEEILEKLEMERWECFEVPFLGVSYGSAHYPEDSKSLYGLISIADHKMYEEKSKKG